MMTRTYALVNQKGGVGKTTTAINLGSYMAEVGQGVLIIDLDPQANATSCLGIDRAKVPRGTYEALIGNLPASECTLHNSRLKLSLMPSTQALAGAQVEIVEVPNRERMLRHAISPLDGHYDYILIDCPPSLGLLTINALLAARDGVIIPVQCEYLALEGLTQLIETLKRVRVSLFPGLSIRGLLLTMFDGRTNLSRDVVVEVRRHFGEQVFQSVIPRSVRLAEAPSHGQPISTYDPTSPGALAYQALAEEVLIGDGVIQQRAFAGTGN